MEIQQVIRNVLYRYPLFGNIIANIKFVYTNEPVPAPIFTDGHAIYYKSEFWNYTPLEQEFLIAHEILHIVLRHLFRNLDKDEDLLNYVEDGIINQILMRNGLPMPDGGINISDALEYSVEELYLRYLSKLDEIKSWMHSNTYHIEISYGEDIISKVIENLFDAALNSGISQKIQELVKENETIRTELLEDYKAGLKIVADASLAGRFTNGDVVDGGPVGKAPPLVSWQILLMKSLAIPDNSTTAFMIVEPDGVLRKEEKNNPEYSECEIIIDSSGSMNLNKIKTFLRECKNILSSSRIKVGFCDTVFYGWNEIRTESDIDELKIPGRGGTSFQTMADTFTSSADNKIVLTDGEDIFPTDRPDILWVVINYWVPYLLQTAQEDPNINVIYINEREIDVPVVKKIGSYN